MPIVVCVLLLTLQYSINDNGEMIFIMAHLTIKAGLFCRFTRLRARKAIHRIVPFDVVQ